MELTEFCQSTELFFRSYPDTTQRKNNILWLGFPQICHLNSHWQELRCLSDQDLLFPRIVKLQFAMLQAATNINNF